MKVIKGKRTFQGLQKVKVVEGSKNFQGRYGRLYDVKRCDEVEGGCKGSEDMKGEGSKEAKGC